MHQRVSQLRMLDSRPQRPTPGRRRPPDTAAPPTVESSGAPARASRPGELPPEILIDRRLVRVDRLLARDDHRAAHDVMNEVLALQREHEVALPAEFPFKYAQVALAAGLPETAVESLNDYLLAVGRDGEFYRDALELLESAEEAVRRADAERRRADAARRRADAARRRADAARRRADAARRRAEAERRRIEARQRENDELARRQREASAVALPRDPLRSGGLAPEMVTVAAGRFQYFTRQDRGEHLEWVTFDRPFAISKYEVTRGEFARFADSSRYRTAAEATYHCDERDAWKRPRDAGFAVIGQRPPRIDQTDDHPVVCVSRHDAMAYAAWLCEQTGRTYRLRALQNGSTRLGPAPTPRCSTLTTSRAPNVAAPISTKSIATAAIAPMASARRRRLGALRRTPSACTT